MNLSRNVTNFFNWVLDNLIPPVLRDATLFSKPFFWILFGRKARLFMNFKKVASSLSKEETVAYYKSLADVHIKRETDLNKACVREILLNVVGKNVLDIACGKGYLAKKIAAQHPVTVIGIDFIVEKESQVSGNPTFIEGHIENIPYPDKYFDTVVCTHTLEHVINIRQALSELRRVCNQKLIIVVPRQREYRYTFDLHVHFFPYKFSVLKFFGNKKASCVCIGNDWLYIE